MVVLTSPGCRSVRQAHDASPTTPGGALSYPHPYIHTHTTQSSVRSGRSSAGESAPQSGVCVGLFTHLARACGSSRDIPSHPRIRVPGEAARDLLRHAAGRLAPQHFHIHIKALGQATGCRERTRIDGRELRERRQALPNLITIGRRRLFAWLADGTCRNGFT